MLKRIIILFALGFLACASHQDGNVSALDAKAEARPEDAPANKDTAIGDCNGGQPFADPFVEAGVRDKLGKPRGPFTPEELAGVTELTADGAASLEGVQCLPGLKVLVATRGTISDLSPLEKLLNLGSVILDSNRIRSLLPLSGHYELYNIGVADNQITSLDGLVLGEPHCSFFDIQNNPVGSTDVQPFCDLGWVVTWGVWVDAPREGVESCNELCL
jgi:Leucine-rich repeat (LRR) protein